MGVKSKKKAKTRLDAYYRLAKDQGYRARSAYKLIQLNRKYDFLAKSRVLVDLCAAPGGWCQVAAQHMAIGSKIVGVDLVPIAPIRGVKTFVGDITDDKTRKIIVTYLKKEPVDCVIHDGAPNVGGVWSRDMYDQNALVLASARMACSMLKLGGWFVTKVFRSPDFHNLLWVLKQLFDKVEATKPQASRMESAEIFVVCAGYKAPKSVDPAFFSPQKVFAEVGAEKVMTPSGMLVTPKNNVPAGYDEFATVSHRVASFSDFLRADDPKGFLKTHHELRFSDDADKEFLKSKSSKKELVYLCGDLQQVGEADLRRMLRWREQLLKENARQLQMDADGEEAEAEEGSDVDSMDGDAGGDRSSRSEGDDDDADQDRNRDYHFDFDSPEGVTQIARELLEVRKKKAKELKKKQKRVVDRKLKQIKGLINYDPNMSAEHMTETDGFDYKGTSTDAFDRLDRSGRHHRSGTAGRGEEDDDDDVAAGGEPDELDNFTVEQLSRIPEDELARIMDTTLTEQADHGNDPLNPVVSVNLAAQDDWDLGDGEEGTAATAEEAEPHSKQLVEGQEYFIDVDNYGNYVPAERSTRVTLYEAGLEGEDEREDGEAEDEESPVAKKKRAKAEKDAAQLEEAGKSSKWQRHQLNVEKILNDTFPTPKNHDRVKNKKRQRALEEEMITMSASTELADFDKKKHTRTRFEDHSDDDDDDDDDDDGDSNASVSDLSDELSDGDLDGYEINRGREDSRRKRKIVPDVGKLTTQELVRQQRKQTLRDNKEVRTQNKRNKNNMNGAKKKGAKGKENTEFEEIPIAMTDPDIRARTLAIAQKMLDPQARRAILDASVNRYVFNDDDDLPDWFVKDEQRNCRVVLPVTAEDIEEQRRRFQELNARPSRKVMEAMGRKRRKAERMLRGLIEKGKADPRAREKSGNLSVRKLMRAQVIKGQAKKKHKYLDRQQMGRMRRDREKAKRDRKKK
ncbi:putative FtsJ cell division protein [Leptomonas pyrrhocoris]|uniref:Putative rRNA methyltransferase n=1 Tax=Leptomonas pyrrhocoris TaxID=157538 RepID=A0A0M9G7Q4_LEPPY|nr:putative FtsJ cell division protein [Leptomonas pyrrhocoris]KPA84273.1 putative FtsJ cell division protein [Leptomonas pyrrhocoris]|eukprot:XP_015662712.1 putative FtsJ cell division protein [Leptomonas pyrrhocoris]